MNKKQLFNIILIAFFVGALGSIFLGRFFIPWTASVTGWESLNKLVSSSPIVINRTTEVQLNEGVNLIELSKQAANTTVSIYQNDSFRGLGIIMSSDGLIFTSRSVIGNNTEVTVADSDGKLYKGLVRATDPKSDLAIVTIEAHGLATVSFASSLDLKAGQRVITLGIANRALERELSSGLVTNSVLNNKYLGQTFSSEKLSDSFATDIVLHSNHAGAPLLNLDGRLIGMFANDRHEIMIAESLQTALNSYLQNGKIIRPKLGIQYFTASALQASINKYNRAGILILSVDKASAAAEAGLVVNDLIYEVNGTGLDNASFEQILNQSNPTAQLKLKLIRAGKEMELTVNLKPTQ